MAVTQLDKGNSFGALHQGTRAFVIANVWDAGSARVLAGLGFAALATSSGASAWAYGTRDGRITRDQALAHARAIVDATDLPVSVDLEHGFGATVNDVAETYRDAAADLCCRNAPKFPSRTPANLTPIHAPIQH